MNNSRMFEEILMLPGAALILADKLSGRIISRIAAGFDEDPALKDMMDLFRTLENKWPEQVLSLREMYDLQLKDADRESQPSLEALEGLTEKQRQIWLSEQTRTSSPIDRLQKALPKIVDLYAAATPNAESWEDLTVINQWSLLNATERGLHDRLRRYQRWAKEDEDKGKTESNAIMLRNDAQDAIDPVFQLVTEFLDTPAIAQALEQDAANGIRVPERTKAA